MTKTFTLGLVQMAMAKDAATNLSKAEAMIADAAAKGAEIVLLPELFTGWYFCQEENHDWFDTAIAIPGPETLRLDAAAKKHGVVICGSFFERRMPGVYHNTSTVHSAEGKLLGIYRKMHIPDDPLYLEKFYFTPGDLGWKCFDTPAAKIGTLVCWDQWYPEAARLTALLGAEVLIYPTAIGWHPKEKAVYGSAQHAAWETSMRGHAIANGIYVAAINRVGHEVITGEGIEFFGQSFVSDPFGRILAKGSVDKEEVLIVECDRTLMEKTRQHWPFFRDRRIDHYGGLVKRVAD